MNVRPAMTLLTLLLAASAPARERLTPEETAALRERALAANDLRACGMPFRLEADLTLPQPDGRILRGKYALIWVGPDRFHRALAFPGYAEVHVKPDTATDWVITPGQDPPTVLRRFDGDFLSASSLAGTTQLRAGKPNGQNVTCLSKSDGGPGAFEACIDTDDGFLVSSLSTWGQVQRGTPREFHGRLCPESFTFRREGQVALTAQLTLLAAEAEPNPAWFAKPAGASDLAEGPLSHDFPGLTPPKLIRHVPPDYPAMARRRHATGTTVLDCVIKTDGSVSVAKVLASSGDPILDEAASACAKQWRYEPGSLAGVPRAVSLVIRIEFSLPGG